MNTQNGKQLIEIIEKELEHNTKSELKLDLKGGCNGLESSPKSIEITFQISKLS